MYDEHKITIKEIWAQDANIFIRIGRVIRHISCKVLDWIMYEQ